MSLFLRQIQHLLPQAKAWSLSVDRTLRRLFVGISSAPDDAKEFVDLVWEDVYPSTTRELAAWEEQHGLLAGPTEDDRIASLDAEWKATGGQSLYYIQTQLRASGFDVYVHPPWIANRTAGSIGELYDPDKSLSTALAGTTLAGFAFGKNGRKLYTVDAVAAEITEWDLSRPYQVESAIAAGTFSVSAQATAPHAIAVSPDGAVVFVTDLTTDTIYQYDLANAWDIESAAYASLNLSVTSQQDAPRGLFVRPDGLALFIVGAGSEHVHEYTLADEWSLDGASYSGNSFDLQPATGTATKAGVSFTQDGTRMLVCFSPAANAQRISEYTLSTEWDISTLAFVQHHSFAITGEAPVDLALGGNGGPGLVGNGTDIRLFVAMSDETIRQYSLADYEPRDPNDYLANPLIGSWTMGDEQTFQGTYPGGPPNVTVVFSEELDGDVDYLVNLDLTTRAPPYLPTDREQFPYFIYIGGEAFGEQAIVPSNRRAEFERLVLKMRPLNTWVGLFVTFDDAVAALTTEDGFNLTTEDDVILTTE